MINLKARGITPKKMTKTDHRRGNLMVKINTLEVKENNRILLHFKAPEAPSRFDVPPFVDHLDGFV